MVAKNKMSKKHISIKNNVHRKPNYTSYGALIALIVVILLIVFSGKIFGDNDPLAAKVDGEKITVVELEEQFDRLPPDVKANLNKEMVLQQMIDEVLLVAEAKRKGYKSNEADAYEIIRMSIIATGFTEEQFYEQLEKNKMDKEYLVDYYKKQIMINDLLNETVISKIEVTEEEIETHYEKVKDNHMLPERRNVSHILFRIGQDRADSEALLLTQNLKKKLTKSNFADMAMENSEDEGTKTRGGYIGLISKGVVQKEFEDALFSMRKNEIKGPVKTTLGYHLIFLQNILPEEHKTFESIKLNLENELKAQKQQVLFKEYIETLRSYAKIQLLYKEDNTAPERNFAEFDDELCEEDGKPLVMMFSTSTCVPCGRIAKVFESVVMDPVVSSKISAHHYILDTNDDLLTSEVEQTLNTGYVEIFKKYSPQQGVPLFVFGCQQIRLGNAYATEENLMLEEQELKNALAKLVG